MFKKSYVLLAVFVSMSSLMLAQQLQDPHEAAGTAQRSMPTRR